MPFELYMTIRKIYFGQQYMHRPKPNTHTEEKESDEHY